MTRLTALLLSLASIASVWIVQNPSTRAPITGRHTTQKQSRGIKHAAALAHFFRALREVESGNRIEPARVMHFGDSHIAADILTRRVRERLQQEFGDGGAGLVLPGNPMSTRRRGVSWGVSDGWVLEGLGTRGVKNGTYGPLGIVQSATRRNERIWLQATGNHFEIYYARHQKGGAFDVVVDGQSVVEEPVSTFSNEIDSGVFSVDVGDAGIHEIQIRTVNDRKVSILGIASENLSGGIAYDVAGVNGARATRLLWWHAEAFARLLSTRKPDLIILSYGTNEVTDGDWTSLGYQNETARVLSFLRQALPETSFLVWGPPDRADVALAARRMTSMNQSQRMAALNNEAAFWSTFEAMGGAGSMNTWVKRGLAQPDRVHLTSTGYVLLGDKFVDDLVRAYRASSRERKL